jgi:protein-tyrosine phosphatase
VQGNPHATFYTRRIEPLRILVVCTANLCRSPMAAGLLARGLARSGVPAEVQSAGVSTRDGALPPGDVVAVMREYGVDLSDHRSRTLGSTMVQEAHLVLAMAREHLREAVLFGPRAFDCSFTLKELARRTGAAGPRPNGTELPKWLAILAADRDVMNLLGTSRDDDVDDPVGMPRAVIAKTAEELRLLTDQLLAALWPQGGSQFAIREAAPPNR